MGLYINIFGLICCYALLDLGRHLHNFLEPVGSVLAKCQPVPFHLDPFDVPNYFFQRVVIPTLLRRRFFKQLISRER